MLTQLCFYTKYFTGSNLLHFTSNISLITSHSFSIFLINPYINLPMTSNFSISNSDSTFEIKCSSELSSISVSNSVIEPSEMFKKWINSLGPFLAAPSAIFTGMDTAARLICDIKPNRSSDGKEFVTEYISFTNSKLFIHAFNFLCGFIFSLFSKVLKAPNISSQTFHISHSTSHT